MLYLPGEGGEDDYGEERVLGENVVVQLVFEGLRVYRLMQHFCFVFPLEVLLNTGHKHIYRTGGDGGARWEMGDRGGVEMGGAGGEMGWGVVVNECFSCVLYWRELFVFGHYDKKCSAV